MAFDPELTAMKPEIYWSMLQTAEQVAKRYNISRDARTSTAPPASRKRLRHRRPACSKPKSPP
jgi:acetyl-CoA C-acetyltransferase